MFRIRFLLESMVKAHLRGDTEWMHTCFRKAKEYYSEESDYRRAFPVVHGVAKRNSAYSHHNEEESEVCS